MRGETDDVLLQFTPLCVAEYGVYAVARVLRICAVIFVLSLN